MFKKFFAALTFTFGFMILSLPLKISAQEFYALDYVRFRNEPSAESNIITVVHIGTVINVTEYNPGPDGWSKVSYDGQNGYMKSEYIGVKESAEKPIYPNDESFQNVESDVKTSDLYATDAGSDIKPDTEKYYALTGVNFRTAPDIDSEKISLINLGTEINVVTYDPDWSYIYHQGTYGYVKSEYIGSFSQYEEALNATSNVEYSHWAEIKNVFIIGLPALVTDVYTGNTYNVKSFSNGKHADVEPITTADTAAMKVTFGGVWSWDVRPVWVTVNGRTFAGSISGMPHGGGVNADNGMDGQVCIHFKGSSTHNGNVEFSNLHQAKALEAYNLAN